MFWKWAPERLPALEVISLWQNESDRKPVWVWTDSTCSSMLLLINKYVRRCWMRWQIFNLNLVNHDINLLCSFECSVKNNVCLFKFFHGNKFYQWQVFKSEWYSWFHSSGITCQMQKLHSWKTAEKYFWCILSPRYF